MLPIVTEEQSQNVLNEIFKDVKKWRKEMIYYLKNENPEINTAIIEATNRTKADPKAIALGAYMTYIMLELSERENNSD